METLALLNSNVLVRSSRWNVKYARLFTNTKQYDFGCQTFGELHLQPYNTLLLCRHTILLWLAVCSHVPGLNEITKGVAVIAETEIAVLEGAEIIEDFRCFDL